MLVPSDNRTDGRKQICRSGCSSRALDALSTLGACGARVALFSLGPHRTLRTLHTLRSNCTRRTLGPCVAFVSFVSLGPGRSLRTGDALTIHRGIRRTPALPHAESEYAKATQPQPFTFVPAFSTPLCEILPCSWLANGACAERERCRLHLTELQWQSTLKGKNPMELFHIGPGAS